MSWCSPRENSIQSVCPGATWSSIEKVVLTFNTQESNKIYLYKKKIKFSGTIAGAASRSFAGAIVSASPGAIRGAISSDSGASPGAIALAGCRHH